MKIFTKRFQEDKGFTLMEVLLYVAIFSLIIGAVAGLAINSTSERAHNQIVADLNYQGESVMYTIVQAVDNSTSIDTPTLGTNSGTLSLSTADPSTNPTVFDAFTDSTTTRMQISEGSVPTQNFLTNSRVRLTNLTFTNNGVTGSKGSVQIEFTLTYVTNSTLRSFNYSKTFDGAATIR
jgi:prepilin-type N-terminal cleavage/methylation domain-containing protein